MHASLIPVRMLTSIYLRTYPETKDRVWHVCMYGRTSCIYNCDSHIVSGALNYEIKLGYTTKRIAYYLQLSLRAYTAIIIVNFEVRVFTK